MLGLKFAYATNGHEIVEFDATTGLEQARDTYPTPEALWQRYRDALRRQMSVALLHVAEKARVLGQQQS